MAGGGDGLAVRLSRKDHPKKVVPYQDPPKVPCLELVFCYIKPSKKHGTFGGPGSHLYSFTSNLGKAKGGSFQKNKKKPIGSGGATLI